MTNLDSVLKSKDITLPTKVHIIKAMVFPVVTCGCESWTIQKGERQRIDAFKLWWWRRLLRVPWTAARKSTQSILKEIHPEYSLEGVMLKLKLQYFDHLMPRADWLERKPWFWEGLKARGEGVDRGWDGWMASLTQWTWIWASLGREWRTGKPGVLKCMGSRRVGHDLATNQLQWEPCLAGSTHLGSLLQSWLQIPASSLTECITFEKVFNFLSLSFPTG